MIGLLPTSLELNGQLYAVRSDFRVVLNIFQALGDNNLSQLEKAFVCVKCLFVDDIPPYLFEDAVKKAYWFCDGGDMPKSEPSKIKTFDWAHDECILFPAVNKVSGCEVRALPYMHWWTFLGVFGEIDEGLFSTVMNIRRKRAEGKKLEKWEKNFYRKHKTLINLTSAEEQEAINETEEFLKTIT